MLDSQTLAVQAIDLCFEVKSIADRAKLLNKFNIRIPKQSVFSLIGPSGCGKTTFLRTLLSIYRPTSGCVKLFGEPASKNSVLIPGSDLGYMTQNHSLCDELTVSEMFEYFGLLYGMSASEAKYRTAYLTQMLCLTNLSQTVGSLSGGEKRRVAFIGAVINAPKLIVLDEPTVGCDPLVCQMMWQYLRRLVTDQQCTIILTTHYLEESRRADLIGFMKNGRILCQGEPGKVMHYFGAKSIEDAFAVMYSENDSQTSERRQLLTYDCQISANKKQFFPTSEGKQRSSRTGDKLFNYFVVFLAIFFRVWSRYLKYKALAFGTMGVTTFLIVLTALCMGSTPKNLVIGVIDAENSTLSRAFLNNIDPLVIKAMIPFESHTEALIEAEEGKIDGLIEINDNFEARLRCYAFRQWENLPLTSCRVATYYGNSINAIVYGAVDHILDESFQKTIASISPLLGIGKNYTRKPIEVAEPLGQSSDPEDLFNVRNFYLSVFMIFWSSVAAMMLSASFYQFDMNESVYEHTRSVGGTRFQVTLANFLVCLIIPTLGSFPIIAIVRNIFHGAGQGSTILIWIFYLLSSYCSIGVGFLLASIFKTAFWLITLVTAFVFASISICGHLRPIHVIPYFIKPIRYFFPYVIIIDEVVRIGSLGINFRESSVTVCFVYSVTYLIACFVMLTLRFKLLK